MSKVEKNNRKNNKNKQLYNIQTKQIYGDLESSTFKIKLIFKLDVTE
jgi:hypothetical protein